MSDGEKLSRKMIFPYTFSAKIAQFPFKLHFKNHWMFPWFVASLFVVSPVFYQIQKAGNIFILITKNLNQIKFIIIFVLANCEANVKIWADKRRAAEEHHKHKWD